MDNLKQNRGGCYIGEKFFVLYFMQMKFYLFFHQSEKCRKLLVCFFWS